MKHKPPCAKSSSDDKLTQRKKDTQEIQAACKALAIRRKEIGVKW